MARRHDGMEYLQCYYVGGVAFDRNQQKVIVTADKADIHYIELNAPRWRTEKTIKRRAELKEQGILASEIVVQPGTDNLLACSRDFSHIQSFDYLGNATHIVGDEASDIDNPQRIDPQGIDCKPDGSFVVTNELKPILQMFDPAGRPVRKVDLQNSPEANSVRCMDRQHAPSASATFLLAGMNYHGRITVIDESGKQEIGRVEVNKMIHGMCIDMNGYIYVSHSHRAADDYGICVLDPRRNYCRVQSVLKSQVYRLWEPRHLCVNDVNDLVSIELSEDRNETFYYMHVYT